MGICPASNSSGFYIRVFRLSDVKVSGDDGYGFPVQDAGSRFSSTAQKDATVTAES